MKDWLPSFSSQMRRFSFVAAVTMIVVAIAVYILDKYRVSPVYRARGRLVDDKLRRVDYNGESI